MITRKIDMFYRKRTAGIWSYRSAVRNGVGGYYKAMQTRIRIRMGLDSARY